MKKTFTLFLAIATIVALAVPAGAKPGKGPGKAPLAGTPCGSALAETGDFTIYLDGKRTAEACVDVSNLAPGGWVDDSGIPLPWDVTATVTKGTLRSLLVILRDSVSPGDACGAPIYHQGNIQANTEEATFDFSLPGAPGSYVNACGVEWAEGVDDVYYGNIDTTVESPLAFLVFARGRDLEMTLQVNMPPLDAS